MLSRLYKNDFDGICTKRRFRKNVSKFYVIKSILSYHDCHAHFSYPLHGIDSFYVVNLYDEEQAASILCCPLLIKLLSETLDYIMLDSQKNHKSIGFEAEAKGISS